MGPPRSRYERARRQEAALRAALPLLERFSRRFTSVEKSMICPGLDDVLAQARRALGEEVRRLRQELEERGDEA